MCVCESIWNQVICISSVIFSFRCEQNYMGRKIKWHECGNAGVIFKIHVAHRRRSYRMEFYFIDAHTALAADCLRCHMVPLLTWNANEPFVASKKRPLGWLAIIFRTKLHRQMPSSFNVVRNLHREIEREDLRSVSDANCAMNSDDKVYARE